MNIQAKADLHLQHLSHLDQTKISMIVPIEF